MNVIFQTVSLLSVIASYCYLIILGEPLQYYQTNTYNNLLQIVQTMDYL